MGPAQAVGACGLPEATRRTPTSSRHPSDRSREFSSGQEVTGGAWLSSARVVRWLTRQRATPIKPEGVMTHHAPMTRYTRATIFGTTSRKPPK